MVNFYYSYQAKKMLETKIEETKNEVHMASRPLVVARAVFHEGATSYEHEALSAPVGTNVSDSHASAPHFSHFELFNAGNSPLLVWRSRY